MRDIKKTTKNTKQETLICNPFVVEQKDSKNCPHTVDLRSKTLAEKKLTRIVDIRRSVSSAAKPKISELPRMSTKRVAPVKPVPIKRKIFFPMPRLLMKIMAITLIVGINWASLSFVGTTNAIFSDEESTKGTLVAGSVEFSLTVTPFDTIAASLNMDTSTSTSKSISVDPGEVSNPFQYYASSTNLSGDEYFCDALMVNASVNGIEFFDGFLKDLTTATVDTLDPWEFVFTTVENHPNQVCHFDIDFNGWQTRNDLSSYEEGGYTDTETVSSSIYSSGFRIQKVFFDQKDGGTIVTGDATANSSIVNVVNTSITTVTCDCDDDCCDSCGDVVVVNNNSATVVNNVNVSANTGGNSANGSGAPAIEYYGWVEIYNQTDVALDLGSWKICDGIACDTIPSDTVSIVPHGFAVITEDATLWHEWNIPDNVVVIALSDSTIGEGIDPAADMIFIKRPDGVVIDQMNWGEPSPAWLNYNDDIWNPGVLVSTSTQPTGKVLAREPLGHDTNRPEDFVELEFPVIDLLYPDEECDDVWYWGHTYPIEWTAYNQNGDNDELLVDIYAIFDDGTIDGELDDEDSVLQPPIAHDIVNGVNGEGAYSWTVPEGFIGTIWIQVVATGPENPMLFGETISGDIWDPIPEEMADNYKEEYLAQQLGFKGFHAGAVPVQVQAQESELGPESEQMQEHESSAQTTEPIQVQVPQTPQVPSLGTSGVVNKELLELPELLEASKIFGGKEEKEREEGTLPDDDLPVGEKEDTAALPESEEVSLEEEDAEDPLDDKEKTPASAESYGEVKPASARGFDEAKEETETNTEETETNE